MSRFVFFLYAIAALVTTATGLTYCDSDCQNGDGYFCVKDDPAKFSVCLGGNRVGTLSCQASLWWDDNLKLCNWPNAVSDPQCACAVATTPAPTTPGQTTTTGSTTTTTTTLPPWTGATRPPVSEDFIRVCYFTNWAVYRQGKASYWAGNVEPFMCTHIIVAFMKLADGKISYLEASDRETLETFTTLRDTQNPALKILIAIGGWNAGSWPFIQVVETNETMDNFITQSIDFMRQHDLDGLDVDWEYPLGYIPQFSEWMLKIRSAFESEAAQSGRNRLLLSAAVAAGQATIDYAYDVPKLSQACDFINVMSYDLSGSWNPTTGLNSGLYPQSGTDPFNVEWVSNYWVQKGAERQKVIIGVPTYGRTFKLCDPEPTETGMGSRACGTGNPGAFTGSAGFEAYYESCLKLQCTESNWVSEWSEAGKAPFMHYKNQWISYENTTSIIAKVQFAKSMNYGGVMVWALDLDDFNDMCGSGVKSPLMATLVAVSTDQPLPTFNAIPNPTVNPCNPTNTGGSTGGGGGGSSGGTSGTEVDLALCDDDCAYDGMYCVPDNEHAFYKCLSGVRYPLQYCSGGLKYNYMNLACDWSVNYPGCNCTVAAKRYYKQIYQPLFVDSVRM